MLSFICFSVSRKGLSLALCCIRLSCSMLSSQVYISTPAVYCSDAMDRLTKCVTQIRDWMLKELGLHTDLLQLIVK